MHCQVPPNLISIPLTKDLLPGNWLLLLPGRLCTLHTVTAHPVSKYTPSPLPQWLFTARERESTKWGNVSFVKRCVGTTARSLLKTADIRDGCYCSATDNTLDETQWQFSPECNAGQHGRKEDTWCDKRVFEMYD